ncbi:MAG: glycosyltransferase family 39 protein, partial [Thermomicrobiales bacterium]|nr:glycosyltransferase family 39 protein [Thermomicrobiales bacterium]
ALGAILIVSLALRLFNLNWDQGLYLHPDERFIADVSTSRIVFSWPPDWDNLFDPDQSMLNPRSVDPNTGQARDFSYGALPLFVTDWAGTLMTKATGENWSSYWGNIYKVGRFLSAVFDTLTVLLVYLIGKRVAGRRAALFAAAIAGLTPMAIQLAHFFTTDSWLTFFVSLTIWLCLRAMESGDRRSFLIAGASFGLAMASKGSVFTLAGLVAVAILIAAWQRRRKLGGVVNGLFWCAERAALAALAALVTFAMFEPYALVQPDVYIDQLMNQSRIIRGTFDVPFTRQYIGTTPILYQIEQVVRWGYGPVAGLLIFIGAAVLGRRLIARPDPAGLLLLAWFVGYGMVIALPETKFLRYLAPLIPVFALLAGIAIEAIADWCARRNWKRLAVAAPAVLLLGAGLWTAAFMNVYAGAHPRIAASEWMYANVPPGSVIQSEYWDDALPLNLSPTLNANAYSYTWASFDFYHSPPAPEAANAIFEQLGKVDYIVMSSNRVASAMPQSPWRYPVQAEYYELLQAEQLGFELVAEFQVAPSFLGIEVDDRNADESFINYDHPRVLIFQKVRDLPREEFDALFAHAVSQPVTPRRHATTDSILLDTPVGELPVVSDARWSASWTDNGFVALLWWMVLLVVLQAAGLPIALLAFRRFADRGWAFARITALLVAGWLVWLLASVEWISFRASWIWLALGLLGLIWFAKRKLLIGAMRNAWRDPATRRSIAVGEIVFWAIFALFLLFRWLNPDSWHVFWGGEKPMEFAYINAILRSAHFPPYDPWFSDGYINYYYYGLYLAAFMMKATGIPSEIAFNLALPTVMATLAMGGYGLAATLGGAITRSRPRAWITGLFGVLLLLLIGNLNAAARILQALPDRIAPDWGWFWGGTRVIAYYDELGRRHEQISEFPYFAALFADLHAHVVAMPITVLVMAIGLAIALESRALLLAVSRRRFDLASPMVGLALFAALGVGALFPTNVWDFFTYAVFILAAFFVAFRRLDWGIQLVASAVVGGLTVGLGYLLYLPFHTHFVTLFSQIKRSEQKTDIWQFSQHFGGLFLLVGIGLIGLIWTRVSPRERSLSPATAAGASMIFLVLIWVARRLTPIDAQTLGAIMVGGFAMLALLAGAWWKAPGRWPWNQHLMVVSAIPVFGLLLNDHLVLALCLALALFAATAFFALNGTYERIIALCATAGFAIPGMVEVIYVADDLDGWWYERMNTMFKFYSQAWVLLAIAGGALTGWLFVSAIGRPLVSNLRNRDVGFSPTLPMVLAATVITLSLAYPLTATLPRLETRAAVGIGNETSLNALDWMSYATYQIPGGPLISWQDDLAAINWMNENIEGSPVIVEAVIGAYRGNGSRFSIATGLPSVVGWERHQNQQRQPGVAGARAEEVRDFYQSTSRQEKIDFLVRYNVEYVIVGDLERYGVIDENRERPFSTPEGIAAIEAMVGNGLEIVFQQGNTTIYRVVLDEITGAPA